MSLERGNIDIEQDHPPVLNILQKHIEPPESVLSMMNPTDKAKITPNKQLRKSPPIKKISLNPNLKKKAHFEDT